MGHRRTPRLTEAELEEDTLPGLNVRRLLYPQSLRSPLVAWKGTCSMAGGDSRAKIRHSHWDIDREVQGAPGGALSVCSRTEASGIGLKSKQGWERG
jgi:hypothetical protein